MAGRAYLALSMFSAACSGCLTTSLASTACDMGHTYNRAFSGPGPAWERNPILGPTPTKTEIGLYGVAILGGIVLADKLLPQPYNAIFHGAVTSLEMVTNFKNYRVNPDFCGIE